MANVNSSHADGSGCYKKLRDMGDGTHAEVVAASLITTLAGEDATRDLIKTLQEVNYTVINATGATVVKNTAGAYFGYQVLGAAGAHTMDVYDNTAASGQRIAPASISVNAAADQLRNTGVKFTNGLTVNLSGDPTDSLILIYWR